MLYCRQYFLELSIELSVYHRINTTLPDSLCSKLLNDLTLNCDVKKIIMTLICRYNGYPPLD